MFKSKAPKVQIDDGSLYNTIVTKPTAGYAVGSYRGPGVWDSSGSIGDSFSGGVRYGVRLSDDGKSWEWEVGIELAFKPAMNWGPLSPEKHWPLSLGVVPAKWQRKDVMAYVQQEAGNWLDVLKLWSRMRHAVTSVSFDDEGFTDTLDRDTRIHSDCDWCMGHHGYNDAVIEDGPKFTMGISTGDSE